MHYRTSYIRLNPSDTRYIGISLTRKSVYGAAQARFQVWVRMEKESYPFDLPIRATFHKARTSDRVIRAGSKAHTWSLILSRPEDQGGNLVTYGATQYEAAEKMGLHLLANVLRSAVVNTGDIG